jgi:hypothetical protein
MRTDVLLVACRDRQPRIECGGGVAARRTEPDTVQMVSAAATPLDVAGDLDIGPQPTVVDAASRHLTSTLLQLNESGRVRLRERVQIGRSDERQGFWSGSLHADVDGAPLLRHRIELGNRSVADDALGRRWHASANCTTPTPKSPPKASHSHWPAAAACRRGRARDSSSRLFRCPVPTPRSLGALRSWCARTPAAR